MNDLTSILGVLCNDASGWDDMDGGEVVPRRRVWNLDPVSVVQEREVRRVVWCGGDPDLVSDELSCMPQHR
jgi:hypothetical protein